MMLAFLTNGWGRAAAGLILASVLLRGLLPSARFSAGQGGKMPPSSRPHGHSETQRCAMGLRMICAGILLALLSGCATDGFGTDGGCAAFGPIYTSRVDVFTDGTAEQLLAHNLTGARLCGEVGAIAQVPMVL